MTTKITKTQLKQLVKEEVNKQVLKEQTDLRQKVGPKVDSIVSNINKQLDQVNAVLAKVLGGKYGVTYGEVFKIDGAWLDYNANGTQLEIVVSGVDSVEPLGIEHLDGIYASKKEALLAARG